MAVYGCLYARCTDIHLLLLLLFLVLGLCTMIPALTLPRHGEAPEENNQRNE